MNAFSHILLNRLSSLVQYDTTYEVDKVVFYKVRNFSSKCSTYFQYETKIEPNSGHAHRTQAVHISQ
jgi:hypothetical protein